MGIRSILFRGNLSRVLVKIQRIDLILWSASPLIYMPNTYLVFLKDWKPLITKDLDH